jgi:hypothetical protein
MRWLKSKQMISEHPACRVCLVLFSLVWAGPLCAKEQIISGKVMSGAGGADVSLQIGYQTSPANEQTTGVGVSVYFDSSELAFMGMSATTAVESAVIGITALPEHIVDDTTNADSDEATDKVATIAFTSFSGRFPSSQALSEQVDGIGLATLLFNYQPAGSVGMTTIHYRLRTASGYSGTSTSTTIGF